MKVKLKIRILEILLIINLLVIGYTGVIAEEKVTSIILTGVEAIFAFYYIYISAKNEERPKDNNSREKMDI
ncbi:MAG: hypothetical protein GY775_16850 [Candidatus Scalindua sp.]|nr:hypothetical protein [Candidatus Scalindua sp.]